MRAVLVEGHLRISALAGLLLALIVNGTASAETAIYYSPPENIYSWCAGYQSEGIANCAHRGCVKQGGSACELVLECPGGWAAIASAQDPVVGFGAICGRRDRRFALQGALVDCIAVSGTLCWTRSLFYDSGMNSTEDAAGSFDQTWIAQTLLPSRYGNGAADGDLGQRTKKAIAALQSDVGLPVTGQPDDATLIYLLDDIGGIRVYAELVKQKVYSSRTADLHDYAYAAEPPPPLSASQALMAGPRDQRLKALAAIGAGTCLHISGYRCQAQIRERQRSDLGRHLRRGHPLSSART